MEQPAAATPPPHNIEKLLDTAPAIAQPGEQI